LPIIERTTRIEVAKKKDCIGRPSFVALRLRVRQTGIRSVSSARSHPEPRGGEDLWQENAIAL
ncbi:MAG: hypothetical protein ACOYLF_10715, partial [Blastocatellia bacterium]